MEKVKIEKLDSFGRGITYINNKICFIENSLPQEECEVKITLEKNKYLEGKVINIVKESNYRTLPICPYYLKCGGCNLLHMDRKSQLIFKEEKVFDLIKKFSKLDIDIKDILYGSQFFYRNKVTLHVKNKKVGLYEEDSNKLVEIDECLLLKKEINNLIKLLKDYIINNNDNINEIIIRTTSLDQTMLIIKGKVNNELIKEKFEFINSIYINNELIYGNKYIEENINDLKFYIYPNSFFQVNYEMMNVLYNKIISFYKTNKNLKVLDLYCGTGTIGMLISKYCEKVIGIEVNDEAIISANECKKINNIKNIEFYLGKVEDKIDIFSNFDSIVVDPPRSGLDKNVIDAIIKIKPTSIIYVSCDPNTLARDLNKLKEYYEITQIQPVDMFANTYHVECLTILIKK